MFLVYQYTVTQPKKVLYYVDPNPVDADNPTTLIKRYDREGSLERVTLYNENCEVVHDFSFSRGAYSMMTDSVTGKHCKVKNINKFMGIELKD